MKRIVLILFCLTVVGAVAAQDATEEPAANLAEAIAADENAAIFTAALDATGLSANLASTESEFTVFVPRDGAFGTYQRNLGITQEAMLSDVAGLTTLLSYHIAPAKYTFDDLKSLVEEAQAERDAEEAAEATQAAQSTEEASSSSDEEEPVTAQIDTIGGIPLTFRYDAANDQIIFSDDQAVLAEADLEAPNGIYHILDNVMIPPDVVPIVPTPAATVATCDGTISDVITRNPELSYLVRAARQVGMDRAMCIRDESFTLFAPTDDAFWKLRSSLGLSEDEFLRNILLDEILGYHIIRENLSSAELIERNGESIQTFYKNNALVPKVMDNGLYINDIVRVLASDVPATNGTIHLVDNVLLPNIALQRFQLR